MIDSLKRPISGVMAAPPPQDPTPPASPDPGDDAHQRGTPENTSFPRGETPGRGSDARHNGRGRDAHPPALRRTVVRPAGPTPDPVDAAYVTNRLTTLTHELSTLLDASLRVIGIARRSVNGTAFNEHPRSAAAGPFGRRDVCPEQLSRQLDAVDAAMRQMADLVRSSMLGMAEGGSAGPRDLGFGAGSSLADAVRHAVDVMTPMAEERHVHIHAEIDPGLAEVAAGPIYAVITNGVRNAVESIQRIGDAFVGGRIVLRAWTENGKTGRCVMITIEDDGAGLPTSTKNSSKSRSGSRKHRDADAPVFKLGYTTKPGGSGIGLALSRDVIEQLGGTINLVSRPKDPHSGRAGAVLSVCYPIPKLKAAG